MLPWRLASWHTAQSLSLFPDQGRIAVVSQAQPIPVSFNRLTYLGLVALAGGQGLALLLLHLSLEHSVWPTTQMPVILTLSFCLSLLLLVA